MFVNLLFANTKESTMRLFAKKNKLPFGMDLTIHELTSEMKAIEREVEKLLLKLGFSLAMVKTKHGEHEIKCYHLGDSHCCIYFMKNYTTKNELKDWVLIEYADSYDEAAVWAFEDGDSIPLDIPIEQIIAYLEQELICQPKLNDLRGLDYGK